MTYEAVNSDDAATAKAQFEDGSCDAWTGDMSAMVAQKFGLDTTAVPNSAIMPELLSKEPLGAATRDNDADWNDVVTWVWFGMLTAEEMDVTSANYAAEATAAAVVCERDADNNKTDSTCTDGDPGKNRLLNMNLGLGTEANPLSDTWMQSVLGAVGNYEEAYTESFCTFDASGDCLIDRAGTLNAPWWEGGLQYAPPMR
jgi:general L-amino acid transport system substrate-binding protein